MYDYSPETCLIKDIDGQLYNIIDLWRGIKQPVDPSTIQQSYAPRTCLVENIDGTKINVIDTILSMAGGSGAGTSCLQEVVQARNEYKTLDERLDTENKMIYDTLNAKNFLPFSGDYIEVSHSKVGFTKDIKITGRTLQNFCSFKGVQNGNWDIDNVNHTLTKKLNVNLNGGLLFDTPLLTPNKEYTFIFNILEKEGNQTGLTMATDKHPTYVANDTIYITPKLGINAIKFRTKADLNTTTKVFKLIINQSIENNTEALVIDDRFLMLEGDYTNKVIPPYFTEIQSSGNKSRNLFDLTESKKLSGPNIKVKENKVIFNQGASRFILKESGFKKNTQYTLSFTKISGQCDFSVFYSDNTSSNNSGNITYTTLPNKTITSIKSSHKDGSQSVVADIQIVEGTVDLPYEPYSVGEMIKYKSVGKNLCNPLLAKPTYKDINIEKDINQVTLNAINLNANWVGAHIPIYLPKGKFTLKFQAEGNGYLKANVINASTLKSISGDILPNTPKTFDNEANKLVFVKLFLRGATETGALTNRFWDIQLEKNASATDYEQYQEDEREILLPYNFGLKGLATVADTLDTKEDGAYITQKIGRYVVTGEEDWGYNTGSLTEETRPNTYQYYCSALDNLARAYDLSISNQYLRVDAYGKDFVGFTISDSSKQKLRISDQKMSIEEFKNKLKTKFQQGNPVVIYYRLATPVKHQIPVDNRDIKTYLNTTHIFSTNIIGPELSLQAPSDPQAVVSDLMIINENLNNELNEKTTELQAKDQYLANEDDVLTAKDLDLDFRIFELESMTGVPMTTTFNLQKSIGTSPYDLMKRCIENGLYDKLDMEYKINRYAGGKRITLEQQEELLKMIE